MSLTFALQPFGPTDAFFATVYPVGEAAAVVRGWRDCVTEMPDEVSSQVIAITLPATPDMPEAVHDRAVIVVGGVYVGDAGEGLRVMASLRDLGNPLLDISGPASFTAVQSSFDLLVPCNTGCVPTGSRRIWTTCRTRRSTRSRTERGSVRRRSRS